MIRAKQTQLLIIGSTDKSKPSYGNFMNGKFFLLHHFPFIGLYKYDLRYSAF